MKFEVGEIAIVIAGQSALGVNYPEQEVEILAIGTLGTFMPEIFHLMYGEELDEIAAKITGRDLPKSCFYVPLSELRKKKPPIESNDINETKIHGAPTWEDVSIYNPTKQTKKEKEECGSIS